MHRKLGGPTFDQRQCYALARIGKNLKSTCTTRLRFARRCGARALCAWLVTASGPGCVAFSNSLGQTPPPRFVTGMAGLALIADAGSIEARPRLCCPGGTTAAMLALRV